MWSSRSRAIVDAVDRAHAMIEFALDGTVLDANANFLRIFGYSLDQIKGRHHAMFVPADERDGAEYREFWAQLRAGQHRVAEFRRIDKSGRDVWIQASYNPIRNRFGQPFKVAKIASDITDAKLRSAEAGSQIAAVGKSQAIIHFALDGTILDANENFLSAFGYSLEDVRGRHHRIFVDPAESGSDGYGRFWEALSRGEFQAGEYRRIGRDGRSVWIQASYNPILDASGRPTKVVKIATDMTEQVTRRLRRDRARRQIDEDLGSVATAVIDASQAANEAADASDRTRRSVEDVTMAAERIAESVAGIHSQFDEARTISSVAVSQTTEVGRLTRQFEVAAADIGAIVEMIATVAAQTNLLALNATIEAARAGEAGRGFAVVAAEVKHLAVRTADATRSIGQHVGAIQTASRDAVAAIDDVGGTISRLNTISQAISAAIAEQAHVTGDVALGMRTTRQEVDAVNRSMGVIAGSARAIEDAIVKVRDASGALA